MIEIQPIQPHQIVAVKQIIITVCQEIWQVDEETIQRHDAMTDLDNVQSHYFSNGGLFLVLLNGGAVVGSGGIRLLSEEICELKRMWLLSAYRGQGLGMQMAKRLLEFAQMTGYQRVRLDVADPHKQTQALKLYQRLGFYEIERYNNSSNSVFMEKVLAKIDE